MFAGLPGIGVGTLFYVLAAFCMPVYELGRVARATSSIVRWRRIGEQWIYALSVLASIAFADRLMLWLLGAATPGSLSPARILHGELGTRAPQSILAAPITASLILLATVLVVVEVFRWRQRLFATPLSGPATLEGPMPSRERATPFLEVVQDVGNKAVVLAISVAPAAAILLRAA